MQFARRRASLEVQPVRDPVPVHHRAVARRREADDAGLDGAGAVQHRDLGAEDEPFRGGCQRRVEQNPLQCGLSPRYEA